MRDREQAAQVKSALAGKDTQVVAVTSGKGGVGKTNVAANLSAALAADGQDVMLLDADFGLANADVLLGLQPKFTLSDVISGDADIDCVTVKGPFGMRVVPATSGRIEMVDLARNSQAAIIQSFGDIAVQPDVLVIDTASGIGESVARFTQAAQHAIVVVCDEPSSITDAYALIKVFSREYGISHFQIVTNMTRNAADGRQLFSKLSRVASQFLDVVLRHVGNIPQDAFLKRAIQEQRAVIEAYPNSWSAKAFRQLGNKVKLLPVKSTPSGGIEFFLEQVLTNNRTLAGVPS